MNRKSIVMSGLKGNEKAVLTLESEGAELSGRVRLYNFNEQPKGIISLGIFSQGKVIKAGLTMSSSMVYTFKAQSAVLPPVFSCAIVNFVNGEPEPILYGTSEGAGSADEIFGAVISSLQGETKISAVEEVLDSAGIDYDNEVKADIEEAIESEFEKHDCAHCRYRDYFYSQQASVTAAQEEPTNEPEEVKETFFKQIKSQVDNLFAQNPTEEYLEELIPNSKWVKVEFDQGGDYYVFGLLYEEQTLKYICYGVPGVFQKTPPKQLSGYPVWFPLDKDRAEGFGYWLSYQDAESGDSIKAVVE